MTANGNLLSDLEAADEGEGGKEGSAPRNTIAFADVASHVAGRARALADRLLRVSFRIRG